MNELEIAKRIVDGGLFAASEREVDALAAAFVRYAQALSWCTELPNGTHRGSCLEHGKFIKAMVKND